MNITKLFTLDWKYEKWYIGGLLTFSLFYNALLAIVNAHGHPMTQSVVAATEMLIDGAIIVYIVPRFEKPMIIWVYFTLIYLTIFCWIIIYNSNLGNTFSPKAVRDYLLVSVFAMLGMSFQKEKGDVIALFRLFSIWVLIFIFFENYCTSAYTSIFDVKSYYANTRDIAAKNNGAENEGLFGNTVHVEGRFTTGFSSHRLSSLFLEQTSLGNFAVMLTMVTSLFWDKLSKRDRWIYILCIFFSLLGSDARLPLGLAFIFFLGHFIFPKLPVGSTLIYMPVTILVCYLTLYDRNVNELESDDLPGRIAWSLKQMTLIDFQGAWGGRPIKLLYSMDSGYSYVIYSTTLIGLLVYWLFTSLIVPQRGAENRRLAHMIALFIALNLMLGQTLLSIKMAAPMWFVVGYIYRKDYMEKLEGTIGRIPLPKTTLRELHESTLPQAYTSSRPKLDD